MASDDHPALLDLKRTLPDWRVYEDDGQSVVAHHMGQRMLFRQDRGRESYTRRLTKLVGQLLAHPTLRLSEERRCELRAYIDVHDNI